MDHRTAVTLLVEGHWSLHQLQAFLSAMDEVYGTFLALRLIRERMTHAAEMGAFQEISLADYLGQSTPRPFINEGAPWAPQPVRPQLGLASGGPAYLPELQYFDFVMLHRYEWMPDAELRINSIRMSSPGSVSLIGLGDLVRELRELLKDLTFRNRQEERLGELEIARRHLELQQARLSPAALDAIAARTITALNPVAQLSSSRQLLLGESLKSLIVQFKELLHAVLSEKAPEQYEEIRNEMDSIMAAGADNTAILIDDYRRVTQAIANLKQRLRVIRNMQLFSQEHYKELEELADSIARQFSVGYDESTLDLL